MNKPPRGEPKSLYPDEPIFWDLNKIYVISLIGIVVIIVAGIILGW